MSKPFSCQVLKKRLSFVANKVNGSTKESGQRRYQHIVIIFKILYMYLIFEEIDFCTLLRSTTEPKGLMKNFHFLQERTSFERGFHWK